MVVNNISEDTQGKCSMVFCDEFQEPIRYEAVKPGFLVEPHGNDDLLYQPL